MTRPSKLLCVLLFVLAATTLLILDDSVAFWTSAVHTKISSFARERAAPPRPDDFEFTWAIFITPQGFEGEAGDRQRRAIESWLRLKPRPVITLVGDEAGYDAIAQEYGCRRVRGLDTNLAGMPLAGSLVHTARAATENVSVIVNSTLF